MEQIFLSFIDKKTAIYRTLREEAETYVKYIFGIDTDDDRFNEEVEGRVERKIKDCDMRRGSAISENSGLDVVI